MEIGGGGEGEDWKSERRGNMCCTDLHPPPQCMDVPKAMSLYGGLTDDVTAGIRDWEIGWRGTNSLAIVDDHHLIAIHFMYFLVLDDEGARGRSDTRIFKIYMK